jgi:RimJ/RimL family protein N-acetyltransferase
MKPTPSAHMLPDGRTIIVRCANSSDAHNLIELKLSYIKGTTSIPLYEDEYRNTVEQEAALIKRYNDEQNSILLVAECEGRLIGNIDLTGSQRRKLFHTGMVGMGIRYEWQNNGIGSLLLSSTLDWAREHSPITIVWLEVYSDNMAGIRLYEKHGFTMCGEIKNFFGNADKISMIKYF